MSSESPTLPTELWREIIRLATYTPTCFDTSLQPDTWDPVSQDFLRRYADNFQTKRALAFVSRQIHHLVLEFLCDILIVASLGYDPAEGIVCQIWEDAYETLLDLVSPNLRVHRMAAETTPNTDELGGTVTAYRPDEILFPRLNSVFWYTFVNTTLSFSTFKMSSLTYLVIGIPSPRDILEQILESAKDSLVNLRLGMLCVVDMDVLSIALRASRLQLLAYRIREGSVAWLNDEMRHGELREITVTYTFSLESPEQIVRNYFHPISKQRFPMLSTVTLLSDYGPNHGLGVYDLEDGKRLEDSGTFRPMKLYLRGCTGGWLDQNDKFIHMPDDRPSPPELHQSNFMCFFFTERCTRTGSDPFANLSEAMAMISPPSAQQSTSPPHVILRLLGKLADAYEGKSYKHTLASEQRGADMDVTIPIPIPLLQLSCSFRLNDGDMDHIHGHTSALCSTLDALAFTPETHSTYESNLPVSSHPRSYSSVASLSELPSSISRQPRNGNWWYGAGCRDGLDEETRCRVDRRRSSVTTLIIGTGPRTARMDLGSSRAREGVVLLAIRRWYRHEQREGVLLGGRWGFSGGKNERSKRNQRTLTSRIESEEAAKPPRNNFAGMDGVDYLIGMLTLVKRLGWNDAFRDDVLYGHADAESAIAHSYAEPLMSLRRALSDAKSCMETLNKVRDHLGKKIRSLKRTSTPLVLEDGIRRLPDELLARIFEIGHLTCHGCKFALHASHVSSRFRQVALQTPLLWAKFSALYKNEQMLGAHSSRWASLAIADTEVEEMTAAGLNAFHNLKHLTYHGDSELDGLDGWNMPMWARIQPPGGNNREKGALFYTWRYE
ncbi:hypothetical protein BD410DRAFT_866187 [Rickenella mellea]|uniref:Uncharacterized protein n=1 Tax=Rickenella mellea TaxID=50990 RepID=A0A4Y7PGP7_9AGAM|nr:hypothetical protein BD410DRAFT_866187 [Rickenella mellea]